MVDETITVTVFGRRVRPAFDLAGTALEGARLTQVPLSDETGFAWIVDVPGGDLVELWREARAAVAPHGLRPVAVTAWGRGGWGEQGLFDRYDADSPAGVLTGARELSFVDALARFPRVAAWPDDWKEAVASQLYLAERLCGSTPTEAELHEVPEGDELALDRWLLAWEEERRPTQPPDPSRSMDWYEPRPDQAVGFALLPVTEPGDEFAHLTFYGAESRGGHPALARILNEWHARYGAELVASWGTMLQLVVARPPQTLDDAWELAVQQAGLAPCTIDLAGEGVRSLARHLWRGERWFLHERP